MSVSHENSGRTAQVSVALSGAKKQSSISSDRPRGATPGAANYRQNARARAQTTTSCMAVIHDARTPARPGSELGGGRQKLRALLAQI